MESACKTSRKGTDGHLSKLIYLVLSIVVLCLSAAFFKLAAGSLSLKKLNIVSFCFYSILVFDFIGAFLVLIGFRDHYLIARINDDAVVIKTCLMLAYTMIYLPLSIAGFNYLFLGNGITKKQNAFVEEKIEITRDQTPIFLVVVLAVTCTAATVYVFRSIGYVPLIESLKGTSNSGVMRQEASRLFTGNVYVRNLIMLTLTPLVSYLAYIYWRVAKTDKVLWGILFAYLFFLTLLIKTYDLEKSPALYYLFYFYIIEILLNNKKITKILLWVILVIFFLIVIMYYFVFDYSGRLFTVSSGPGGRIFMTQVATLFLHVKAFPAMTPYLKGASLPSVLATVFGIDKSWVRSGRIVMEIFNPAAVEAGVAGVMNTLFIGEAYANWGVPGVLLAPLFVAFSLSLSLAILLRFRKSPVSLTLYIALFNTFTGALQGGFVDFLYNFTAIFVIIAFLALAFLVNRGFITVKRRR